METAFQAMGRRLLGRWTSEATHPQMPGTVVAGTADFEWLEEDQVLIVRSRYEHPDLPDAMSIIDDSDGLRMYYFDARGVHRMYEITVSADGWTATMDRRAPSHSFASDDAPFSQRATYTLEPGDRIMNGKGQLSHDDASWDDDLEITYRRAM
jgi:hypothetical protein